MARLLRSVAAVAVVVAAVLASPAAAQGGATPAADGDAPPYRNHTVGGADGWFFDKKSNATSGNYSSWAAGETFYLGDYLIFKTNANSSVVSTTNATTYALCDASEDDSRATYIYGGGGGGGGGVEETTTVAVPLTAEGTNYFFSEADGGVQCEQGMRFEIKVQHGQGLAPSLKHPPPPPKERVLAPPPAGTAFSGTGTVQPGNGAGDNGGEGRSDACRVAGVRGRFVGIALAVALVVLAAA
uniref:Phytocyanin domain-containing protein n=1 Tax=Arundo donax TaxID=35708 RepID=A0A0A9CTQ0_ARUDO